MRSTLAIAAAALAALALAGTGHAALPACANPCLISASDVGFNPPVAVIASGTSVQWQSTDFGHANADGLLPNSPACFFVDYSLNVPSDPVTLAIDAGALTATQGGDTTTCANAIAAPDGSFVLPYYCVIHPNMRGALLVQA